MNFFKV